MAINYQDPLKPPYRASSRRRFLRGTLAHRTVLKAGVWYTVISVGSGLGFYYAVDKETWRARMARYDEWRGPQISDNRDFARSAEPTADEDVLSQELERFFSWKRFRFWKPSFWLNGLMAACGYEIPDPPPE
ncbi:uncharacterized protein LOC100903185 [Galendromus occidentalis]|uniref:Uncharacterized protein LOC100903185 n=1 Tax=Galendromus occidentalis TaxID=34638 RepID=A0AAJ6QWP4_9ACAR|nr:uncharacterized protein LOC100903185 [Galendromus occidentalis]